MQAPHDLPPVGFKCFYATWFPYKAVFPIVISGFKTSQGIPSDNQ